MLASKIAAGKASYQVGLQAAFRIGRALGYEGLAFNPQRYSRSDYQTSFSNGYKQGQQERRKALNDRK